MKTKTFSFIFILILISFPFLLSADGGVIRPLPEGDWTWVDENSQHAFINYEEGTEKLIIAVDIEKENSDIAWIIPVPSGPEKTEIDITSELPIFFGDDVISKARVEFSDSLKFSYYGGLLGQIWTFPFSIILVSMDGARGGAGEGVSGDSVAVEAHIEKEGMIAEVITAKNSQAIYNYFSQKGFDIQPGSISELNSYIEKDYTFIVSWIAPGMTGEKYEGQRGIFISFPTSKIYYPLILTSAYGEAEIPIVIRVLDHVKPEIFSEIKPYTEVNYFTERTEGGGSAREARCRADMRQFVTVMELYYADHNNYPSSLQELKNDENWGDDAKNILESMGEYCQSAFYYSGKDGNDYIMRLRSPSGRLWILDSSGGPREQGTEEKGFISPELQKFYGNKEPWKGDADYTKITINAPAKVLKKDLWMEGGRPLKISFALWTVNNSIIVTALLYLLIVGTASFIAGGIAGLKYFRKFKKYAIVGLSNIFTLLGLVLALRSAKKKEEVQPSSTSFVSLFSLVFILLISLVYFLLAALFGNDWEDLWPFILLGGWIFLLWLIALLVRFLIRKIGFKNKAINVILSIILFIVCLALINFLIFSAFGFI